MFKLKAPRFGVSRAFGPWRLGTSFGVERKRRAQQRKQDAYYRQGQLYSGPQPTPRPQVVTETYVQAVTDVLMQRYEGAAPATARNNCERWVHAVFEAEGRL